MCLENVSTTNMSQIGLNHLSHIGIRKVDEQSLKQSRWELDLEEHLVSREVSLVISCRTLKLKIFLTQVPCWLLLLFININLLIWSCHTWCLSTQRRHCGPLPMNTAVERGREKEYREVTLLWWLSFPGLVTGPPWENRCFHCLS